MDSVGGLAAGGSGSVQPGSNSGTGNDSQPRVLWVRTTGAEPRQAVCRCLFCVLIPARRIGACFLHFDRSNRAAIGEAYWRTKQPLDFTPEEATTCRLLVRGFTGAQGRKGARANRCVGQDTEVIDGKGEMRWASGPAMVV